MDELLKYSNPTVAQRKAFQFYGPKAILYRSHVKGKKYAIIDLSGNIVNFGQMGYEDYTKHADDDRRRRYLKRSANIKGDWKKNIYSPNYLSRTILW
jgi:hypothetical protein